MMIQSEFQQQRTESSEIFNEKKDKYIDLPQIKHDMMKSSKFHQKQLISLLLDENNDSSHIKDKDSLNFITQDNKKVSKKESLNSKQFEQSYSKTNIFQKQLNRIYPINKSIQLQRIKTNETLGENHEPSDIQNFISNEPQRSNFNGKFRVTFYKHNPTSIEKAQQHIFKRKQTLPKKINSLIGTESKKTMLNAAPAIGNYSPCYSSLYKHSPRAYLNFSKKSFQIIPQNPVVENKPTKLIKIQKTQSDDNNFEQQFQRLIRQIKNEVQTERLHNPNVYLHPNENLTIKQTMNAEEAKQYSQKMKLYISTMRESLHKIKGILNRD